MITRFKTWLLQRKIARLEREGIRLRSFNETLMRRAWTRTGRIKG